MRSYRNKQVISIKIASSNRSSAMEQVSPWPPSPYSRTKESDTTEDKGQSAGPTADARNS